MMGNLRLQRRRQLVRAGGRSEIQVATGVDNKLRLGVVLQAVRWDWDQAIRDNAVAIDVQGDGNDKGEGNLKQFGGWLVAT